MRDDATMSGNPGRTRQWRWRRPATAIACSALCLLLARPAYAADPIGTTVPDGGARPVAAGQLRLPGGATTPLPPTIGPLAQQILAERNAVEVLGEKLKQLELDTVAAHNTAVAANQTWLDA